MKNQQLPASTALPVELSVHGLALAYIKKYGEEKLEMLKWKWQDE